MTTFVYKAKKDTAETVTGTIKAQTQDEAIDLINQLGLLPVVVEEKGEQLSKAPDVTISFGQPKHVRTKELYFFSRQLANLLKSGVTILKALTILSEQTDNAYFRKIITRIAWEIKNGRSFSESLALYPGVFNSLFVTMINAGEESGNLRGILEDIAAYHKSQAEITSKVRMALAYPVLMGVVGLGTIYFVLTYVFPKMADLFKSLGDALPLPTVMLLKVSTFLQAYWLVTFAVAFGVIGLLYRWSFSQPGRIVLSKFFLKAPLLGDILLKTELARFCRTFVMLLHSGVPILRALQIAIPVLHNEILKSQLTTCKEALTTGGSFGKALKRYPNIPSMMGHLVTVGEESGNLNEVLMEVAETYEQEVAERIKVMTTLIEPAMILMIGGVVGFIVFAMLLPIFQIDVLAR